MSRWDVRGNQPKAYDQSEIIAFLSRPESYPEPALKVERIDTHGAIVFLAGSKAYKLKRAVTLPYLDFSTIDKRATACLNEFNRNIYAAPDIYIAAAPLTRTRNGCLAINGCGKVVDWLVVMHRFDQVCLFDDLAIKKRLGIAFMKPLADCIAQYHIRAKKCLSDNGDEIIVRVIRQISSTAHYAEDKLGLGDTLDLSKRMISTLNQHSRLLKLRSMTGCVRLCHGDLHLRNIVLLNGKSTLFDALEFDDSLATIDVLYDLAFLLMDLWHRQLKKHANLCFNAYVSASVKTTKIDGLAAMPLFMSVRAAIRGMVAIDKANVTVKTQFSSNFNEARDYFTLAKQFLETSHPVLIAVGGLSGAGKTTLAANIAPYLGDAPGALHLRSDVERKRLFGIDPLENLPSQNYSSKARHHVCRYLCDRAASALNAGCSVIVDAVFLEPIYRKWIEQVAGRERCKFLGLWLEADRDQLIKRVTRRKNDASDANADVVRAQSRSHNHKIYWTYVDTRGPCEDAIHQTKLAIMRQLGIVLERIDV